jgi:hypothetical protein
MLRRLLEQVKNNPIYLVYFYFILVAGFLAFSFTYGVAPDEKVHYPAVELYSSHTPFPNIPTQTDFFEAGQVSRSGSFFYYYISGFFFRFFDIININPLVPLRLINVLMATLTLMVLYKISRLLGVEKRISTAAVFVIANIPMFIVLSTGVNYDNAIILLSALAALYLLKLSTEFTVINSLFLLNFLAIGAITKFAFMPIAFVSGAYLVYLFLTKKENIRRKVSKKSKRKIIILSMSLGFMLLLFAERYGGNYVMYKQLNPSCESVLSEKECTNNLVYKRAEIYKAAELEEPVVNYGNYIPDWYEFMTIRTFGVLGHKYFTYDFRIIYTGMALSLILGVAFIRRFKFDRSTNYIPLVFFVYVVALICTNISSYKVTQEAGLAVQGRYIFPVSLVFIIYIISLHNRLLNKKSSNNSYKIVLFLLIIFAMLIGPLNIRNGINYTWVRANNELVKTVLLK